MDAVPPTYEAATVSNPWDLVAHWLSLRDLCSATLVCKKWRATFTPHIWGSPGAHFDSGEEETYATIGRFLQCLPRHASEVLKLTHTLHLPPGPADLYLNPPDAWLCAALRGLIHLQALVVRRLSFFDHGSLVALRPRPFSVDSFPLRLLDASGCENATSTGLVGLLKRLDHLLYLDLSFTFAAKDRQVLSQLATLTGLQVLKLRGLKLKDEEVHILSKALGTRVRSLDVRDNYMTDDGAGHLVDSCFTLNQLNNEDDQDAERALLLRRLGAKMLSVYQGVAFDGHLRRILSSGFVSRLAFEDAPESGITHLYISNNRLSGSGLCMLLKTQRLHVLDAAMGVSPGRQPSESNVPSGEVDADAARPLLALADRYGENLTHVRINHELVTVHKYRSPDLLPLPHDLTNPLQHASMRGLSERSNPSIAAWPSWPNPDSDPDALLTYQPAFTPHVRTIVLASFPSHSKDSAEINRFMAFVEVCATAAQFAYRTAMADYALPPSRQSRAHRLEAAKRIFALETIVLEVVDTGEGLANKNDMARQKSAGWKGGSVAGGRDTEELWKTAESDFSFFDGDGDKGAWTSGASVPAVESSDPGRRDWTDNIAVLGTWRREKKAEWEAAMITSRGGADIREVQGYWPGVVKVVRLRGEESQDEDEEHDYFRRVTI